LGWLEGRGANKAQEYESKYLAKLEAERQAEEKLARHHDELASGIITEPEPTKKESHKKPDEDKKQIGTGTVVFLALFFMFFISMNLMILLEAVPMDISVPAQDTAETTSSIETVTYKSAPGIFLSNLLNNTSTVSLEPTEINVNTHMMLIVILGGALGAKLHGLAALSKHLQKNREKITENHILWYLMRPFSGAVMALVFYFAIKGGALTTTGVDMLNPYGLVTMGIVVGLAEEKALTRIRTLIDAMFGQEGKKEEKEKAEAELIKAKTDLINAKAKVTEAKTEVNKAKTTTELENAKDNLAKSNIELTAKNILADKAETKVTEPKEVEKDNLEAAKARSALAEEELEITKETESSTASEDIQKLIADIIFEFKKFVKEKGADNVTGEDIIDYTRKLPKRVGDLISKKYASIDRAIKQLKIDDPDMPKKETKA